MKSKKTAPIVRKHQTNTIARTVVRSGNDDGSNERTDEIDSNQPTNAAAAIRAQMRKDGVIP